MKITPMTVLLFIVVALIIILSAGCSLAPTTTKPAWYVPQGLNLSECGPAVAAMGDRWATGSNATVQQTRATNPRGINTLGWWSLANVQQYLTSRGIKSRYVSRETPLPYGAMGIYQKGIHFVTAVRSADGGVIMADPLQGAFSRSVSDMTGNNITGAYLLVTK